MTQVKHPLISFGLVTLQFSLIGLLLLMLSISLNPIALGMQTLAIVLGLWAVQTMHLGHFNIIPDPMPDIELVTHGPYRFIRHPMYFSIMLFFLPLVLLQLDWLTLSLYANLCIILFIKLSYEEHLLLESVPDYEIYQQRTKKLIPYLL